jgi:hypothetical protein
MCRILVRGMGGSLRMWRIGQRETGIGKCAFSSSRSDRKRGDGNENARRVWKNDLAGKISLVGRKIHGMMETARSAEEVVYTRIVELTG